MAASPDVVLQKLVDRVADRLDPHFRDISQEIASGLHAQGEIVAALTGMEERLAAIDKRLGALATLEAQLKVIESVTHTASAAPAKTVRPPRAEKRVAAPAASGAHPKASSSTRPVHNGLVYCRQFFQNESFRQKFVDGTVQAAIDRLVPRVEPPDAAYYNACGAALWKHCKENDSERMGLIKADYSKWKSQEDFVNRPPSLEADTAEADTAEADSAGAETAGDAREV